MKRKTIIKISPAGSAGLAVFPLTGKGNTIFDNSPNEGIPCRHSGCTGAQVSLLGIGGWQTGTDAVPQEVLNSMIDLDMKRKVNYIETAPCGQPAI